MKKVKRLDKKKILMSVLGSVLIGTNIAHATVLTEPIVVNKKLLDIPVAELVVDGRNLSSDYKPLIYNDRTLVPVRTVAEALGAEVEWNQEHKEVYITKETVLTKNLTLKIGDTRVVYLEDGGELQTLETDVAPMLVDYNYNETKTMVPIRVISEILDCEVEWNQDTKTVSIHSTEAVKTSNEASRKMQLASTTDEHRGNIEVETDGNMVVVKGVSNYKTSVVHNPLRYVIDFENHSIDGGYKEFTPLIPGVKSIRTANNDTGVRVVLDATTLDEEIIFQDTLTDGTLYILVNTEDTSNTVEATLTKSPDTTELENIIEDLKKIEKKAPEMVEVTTDSDGYIERSKETTYVVIDAGHGGKDSGAVGKDGTTKEKDINLSVALKLDKALRDKGYKTYLMRENDRFVDIYDRARISNANNASLFVSIHANSTSNSEVMGVEVLYAPHKRVKRKPEPQKMFAEMLLNNMVNETKAVKRNAVARPDLVVLNSTDMTAALVEVGFMSNDTELGLIKTDLYQSKLVRGIVKGIDQYIDK